MFSVNLILVQGLQRSFSSAPWPQHRTRRWFIPMKYSTHKRPGCQYLFQSLLCHSPYFSRTATHFTIHSLQSLKASTGFGKSTWSELIPGAAPDASLGSSSIHLSSALKTQTPHFNKTVSGTIAGSLNQRLCPP